MKRPSLCIVTEAKDLQDGLFGNVFDHVFQILPYLFEKKLFPAWRICASEYGDPPDHVAIPGAVDIAYQQPAGPYHEISLADLRRQQGRIIGSDWHATSHMWKTYFSIPPRIVAQADAALPKGRALGLHYRGNDKLTNLTDSNPFTQDDFLALVLEFLERRSDFDFIFAATDEYTFVKRLGAAVRLPVINLGEVGFHKAANQTTSKRTKADRAMLDCVLLSRCHCAIETSSALPSFAKVFNPDLEIYRTAASKLFKDVPYFPVAFIPILPTTSTRAADTLQRSLVGDWTFVPQMRRYLKRFASVRRKPLRQAIFRLGYRLGADNLIRKAAELRSQQIRRRLRAQRRMEAGM